jgi:hypothetical protein
MEIVIVFVFDDRIVNVLTQLVWLVDLALRSVLGM